MLFARRMLRFPEVQSLEIDPVQATATLRYRAPPGAPRAFVRRLADALTGGETLEPGKLPLCVPKTKSGHNGDGVRRGLAMI